MKEHLMKCTRFTAAALLTATLAFGAAGCGGSQPAGSPAENNGSSKAWGGREITRVFSYDSNTDSLVMPDYDITTGVASPISPISLLLLDQADSDRSWDAYNGKQVTVDSNKTYWPSDANLLLGAPRCVNAVAVIG
jgi:hypothetical protein